MLSKDNIQEYVDGIIKANVPDINKNKNCSTWSQHIKFTHNQNHVVNIMIIADITWQSFSQIKKL